MVFVIDFDGTVVRQEGRDYEDVKTPPEFMPGAREALHALKRAGHTLLLFSGRANRSLREDPELDPLVRVGAKKVNRKRWEASRKVNVARYEQMLAFVVAELPGVIDAIDDGRQGKPSGDVYLDDKALKYGLGALAVGWKAIAHVYGEAEVRKAG